MAAVLRILGREDVKGEGVQTANQSIVHPHISYPGYGRVEPYMDADCPLLPLKLSASGSRRWRELWSRGWADRQVGALMEEKLSA